MNTNIPAGKVTITSMLTALSLWLEWLIIPVAILLASMTIDYITGLWAAEYRGEKIDSAKGISGLKKKVLLLLLVAVGLLLDMLLFYCSSAFGFDIPMKFIVAVVIAVWLTINEIISILENIKDTGVHLPAWLLPMVKNLKSKVESVPLQVEKEDAE